MTGLEDLEKVIKFIYNLTDDAIGYKKVEVASLSAEEEAAGKAAAKEKCKITLIGALTILIGVIAVLIPVLCQ